MRMAEAVVGWWALWDGPSVALAAPSAGVGGSPWLGWLGQGSGCQLPSTSKPTANALRNTFQPRPNTLQIRGGVGVLIPALPFPVPPFDQAPASVASLPHCGTLPPLPPPS